MSEPLRILILEDRATDAELVLHEVRKEGIEFAALRVDTENDFRRQLREFRPGLILADYNLPAYDGLSALAVARQECADVPFILVSGTLGEEKAIQALHQGATDYVLKQNLARMGPSVRRALHEAEEWNQRKRAEEALQKSEAQLANAVNMANMGHWELDIASGMFTFSDSFYAIFHTNAREMGGYQMSVADYAKRFVHPEDAPMVGEETRKALETDDPDFNRYIEHRMLYTDGGVGHIAVRFFIVKDGRGKTIKTYGVNQDITERKRAEEERNQFVERLRKALRGTVQAVAVMVETRDPYTAGHQRRVSDLARAIANEMNLSRDQIDGLCTAATIHDIGKISIPAEILTMPRRLTDIEFSLIKTHAQSGYDILKDIEFPWPIARMILEHHERLDGSGYPNGLTGENILIESRILMVADVVEAIASHRPYRPALEIHVALEEITRNKGTHYDPDVVEACLRLFNEKGYKLVD